jgi:hypothetical protein
VRIEHWREDARHGRSCVWKDGALASDELYKAGVVVD